MRFLKRKKDSKKKYIPELRSFVFTLNFYSSKAYNYVRKKFQNLRNFVRKIARIDS